MRSTVFAIRIILFLTVYAVFFPAETEAIEVDGIIEPHRIIKMGGSGTPGILENVAVDRGDVVKTGQVLATLQSGVEKASLEIARARAQEDARVKVKVAQASLDLALARAELEVVIKARRAELDLAIRKEERSNQLYKKDFVPFAEMDESETNRRLAEAQLDEAVENKKFAELEYKRAQAQLDEILVAKRLAELEYERASEVVKRLIIKSPIDGVVVERYLSSGEYVEEQSILKLAQIHPLNVEVILPVKLYLSIKVGMRAVVKPEAPLGGQLIAEVKVVDKVVDAASGTFGVRLELPNPTYKLPGGLKCKVIFPSL
jgi:multidrug efflux pump subunit AcrA (membrane-fusion protein)